jgi:ABC-type branched-subunit amino acid transport system substrate-binding protein
MFRVTGSLDQYGRSIVRKSGMALGFASLFALAACQSGSNVTNGLPGSTASQQASQVAQALTPNPAGEVIGSGNVRVALLVPSSIPGGAAAVAKELRNGAAMAAKDFGGGRVQLVVKDTAGQAAVAQTKASEAIKEGASLILGPLFAANVSAASGITLPANIVTVAFSTDTTVARRGVYLFSYTPQEDTKRIISYAGSLGRRSIAAFLPNNAEGLLRERVLREMAAKNGFQVNVVKYDRTPAGIAAAATQGAGIAQTSDTIYVPEGGTIPKLVLTGLKNSGTNLSEKTILGSGNWESVNTQDSVVSGAYYPGRDISKFNDFASRYQSLYGKRPGVNAGLAYDAMTLAAEFVRLRGNNTAFAPSNFENPNGFQGVNGAFRIRSDGTTQRGLAVYQIRGGAGTLAEPAVSRFSRAGG